MFDDESLDAVYYTRAAPSSLEALTVLALVFDRIHFPGVRVPTGIDRQATAKEIARLRALPSSGEIENATQINLLVAALHLDELARFCVFSGNGPKNQIPELEPGAQELAVQIEQLYWGPPGPDFFPIITGMHVGGAPGTEDTLAYPGIWTYTGNAVLYARRHGGVLVNLDPSLPVPGGPDRGPKGDAKTLALILAVEAVRFALPKLKAMELAAIADFRDEMEGHLRPFRLAMLKLSRDLNGMLGAGATVEEAQKNARFLVETTVYPQLAELAQIIHDPGRPWYKRAVDLTKEAPEIAAAFFSMPSHLAIAKLLASLAGALANYRDDQIAAEKRAQNGLYYLLKLRER